MFGRRVCARAREPMPVLRINNYFDAYRLRAQAEDLHELAARPDKKAVTEFVNRQIMEMIELQPEDSLVDIGCGDGSLPRMAAGRCTNAIGIVSTEEEQRRLAAEFPALSIKAGDVQSLPLASQSASKVVCNATLLYLQSDSEVQAALCEIARIARPGATVLVGEIPKIDEYAHYGIYRGTYLLGFL